eukprot:1146252-Pelagomonas_calceolata.AAC.3
MPRVVPSELGLPQEEAGLNCSDAQVMFTSKFNYSCKYLYICSNLLLVPPAGHHHHAAQHVVEHAGLHIPSGELAVNSTTAIGRIDAWSMWIHGSETDADCQGFWDVCHFSERAGLGLYSVCEYYVRLNGDMPDLIVWLTSNTATRKPLQSICVPLS